MRKRGRTKVSGKGKRTEKNDAVVSQKPDKIAITRLRSVNEVISLDKIPHHYPYYPDPNRTTAFILDEPSNLPTEISSQESLNSIIKDYVSLYFFFFKHLTSLICYQDWDSWGHAKEKAGGMIKATTGSSDPVKVKLFDDLECRRSQLQCQGINHCEFFQKGNTPFDETYQRSSNSMEDWRAIDQAELDRQEGIKNDSFYKTAM
jgi:hypothetical protein